MDLFGVDTNIFVKKRVERIYGDGRRLTYDSHFINYEGMAFAMFIFALVLLLISGVIIISPLIVLIMASLTSKDLIELANKYNLVTYTSKYKKHSILTAILLTVSLLLFFIIGYLGGYSIDLEKMSNTFQVITISFSIFLFCFICFSLISLLINVKNMFSTNNEKKFLKNLKNFEEIFGEESIEKICLAIDKDGYAGGFSKTARTIKSDFKQGLKEVDTLNDETKDSIIKTLDEIMSRRSEKDNYTSLAKTFVISIFIAISILTFIFFMR